MKFSYCLVLFMLNVAFAYAVEIDQDTLKNLLQMIKKKSSTSHRPDPRSESEVVSANNKENINSQDDDELNELEKKKKEIERLMAIKREKSRELERLNRLNHNQANRLKVPEPKDQNYKELIEIKKAYEAEKESNVKLKQYIAELRLDVKVLADAFEDTMRKFEKVKGKLESFESKLTRSVASRNSGDKQKVSNDSKGGFVSLFENPDELKISPPPTQLNKFPDNLRSSAPEPVTSDGSDELIRKVLNSNLPRDELKNLISTLVKKKGREATATDLTKQSSDIGSQIIKQKQNKQEIALKELTGFESLGSSIDELRKSSTSRAIVKKDEVSKESDTPGKTNFLDVIEGSDDFVKKEKAKYKELSLKSNVDEVKTELKRAEKTDPNSLASILNRLNETQNQVKSSIGNENKSSIDTDNFSTANELEKQISFLKNYNKKRK